VARDDRLSEGLMKVWHLSMLLTLPAAVACVALIDGDYVYNAPDASVADGGDAGPPIVVGGWVTEGSCYRLANLDFTNAPWVHIGQTWPVDGGVRLTDAEPSDRVGLFARPPSPVRTFRASFTFRLANASPTTGAGDGIALAWSFGRSTPTLGSGGFYLAVCPQNPGDPALNGKALALRVNGSAGFGLLDPSLYPCAEQGHVAYPFTEPTQIAVQLGADGALTGSVALLRVSLDAGPGQPIEYVGFTAATGGDYAEFYVEDLSLLVCP
jgi:hypothetical protein